MSAVADRRPLTRELFDKLQAEKAKIVAALAPYREFHDKHVNDPKFLEARAKIKAAAAVLGPIDQELAGLARALGAKTLSGG